MITEGDQYQGRAVWTFSSPKTLASHTAGMNRSPMPGALTSRSISRFAWDSAAIVGPGTLMTSAMTQVWASVTMRESKSSACGVSSQVMVTPGWASWKDSMRPVKNSPKSVLRFCVAKRISPCRSEARSISVSSRLASGISHSTPGAAPPASADPEPSAPPAPPPSPQPASPAVSTVPVSPAVMVLREMVVAMGSLPVVRHRTRVVEDH